MTLEEIKMELRKRYIKSIESAIKKRLCNTDKPQSEKPMRIKGVSKLTAKGQKLTVGRILGTKHIVIHVEKKGDLPMQSIRMTKGTARLVVPLLAGIVIGMDKQSTISNKGEEK